METTRRESIKLISKRIMQGVFLFITSFNVSYRRKEIVNIYFTYSMIHFAIEPDRGFRAAIHKWKKIHGIISRYFQIN